MLSTFTIYNWPIKKNKNFYNHQVLAWLDGGWEGNALSEEEPDFIVCSASGDGEDMLVIGVAMEQEDAILTCKVFKGKCKIFFLKMAISNVLQC